MINFLIALIITAIAMSITVFIQFKGIKTDFNNFKNNNYEEEN